MSRKTSLLPQVSFSILFALSLKPRHGYELIRQIKHDSNGRITLGPGALYGSIKRLAEDNLIEGMPYEGSNRRHYYRLTRKGWDALNADLDYYEVIIKFARKRKIDVSHSTDWLWRER